MRLHKRIAASGLCSRRAAEKLIADGRVQVNGATIREMGVKVEPDDVISVDGEVIGLAKMHTLVMNKPVGLVTTLSDPHGRPTVRKLLPNMPGVMLKPVGRLDMDSEGLLLFTNDGELANRLAHPRYHVDKEYEVIVKGEVTESELSQLRSGVFIEGGKTSPATVERVGDCRNGEQTKLKFIIHEGRRRQIRLMCDSVGHPVISLRRVRIAFLTLKGMPKGMCQMLGKEDVERLRKLVGLA